jgi:hypothetical protein
MDANPSSLSKNEELRIQVGGHPGEKKWQTSNNN